MINAGSIQADLFEGDITYQDVLDVLPFSADIIVKNVGNFRCFGIRNDAFTWKIFYIYTSIWNHF